MFSVRNIKTGWRVFAIAIGAAVAVTLVTSTTYAAQSAAAAEAGGKVLPMSTSWPTPQRGIVLSYPSRTAGSRPSLFITGDGGRNCRKLPAPSLPFPADNDTPDATWAGGVIAVTDGTHIMATRDGGSYWSAVRLTGLPASGSVFVGHITMAHGRMFTTVTSNGAGGGSTAAVYSGPAWGSILRVVPGLSISGDITYGNITAVGGLQVSLGSDYATEGYWLSRDGVRFVPAPLPCPVTTTALLGGTRNGQPIALCSGSPSDVNPGQNDHQVWTARRRDGRFSPSSPVFVFGNQQAFAAASDHDMTVASVAGLDVSLDGGQTWTAELPSPTARPGKTSPFPAAPSAWW